MGGCPKNSAQIPFVQRDVPLGTIVAWHGSIEDIPGTWRLCDGTLKTPDLRNKFIAGADDTYAVNQTGGVTSHDHDFTSTGHIHNLSGEDDFDVGATFALFASFEVETGTTDSKNSLPPFHSLAYIMYAGRIH